MAFLNYWFSDLKGFQPKNLLNFKQIRFFYENNEFGYLG